MDGGKRIVSIDMLRGLVVALMALDHVRDFYGFAPFIAEDLAATTPGWFWTRWITHLCAPVFVFLAGSSAFLRGQKTGLPDLSRYLVTRGLLLIALEVTWISFSWQLNYQFTILQVLWALGAGMIVLAALAWLPRWAIALVAAALILPHNLLDQVHVASPLWFAWHEQNFQPVAGGYGVMFMYPLMPWLGLIAAGYAFGPVFQLAPERRQRILWGTGLVLLAAFVILRLPNVYGDPDPWTSPGRGTMFDLMAFMKVQKYPPSLLYLCATGGIGLLLLAAFERVRSFEPLLTFGRHPLFFYVIHIALIHASSRVYAQLRYGDLPNFFQAVPHMPNGSEPSLTVVYVAWAVVLLVMFALCRAWAQWLLKRRPASPQPRQSTSGVS
ncbi:DUF1624 domain-containing protein [Massilia arenosa]|uniref:DUF1624 domain-containing protein n=1 Tax=Zemynaea arenosa TaxID=2561931 RepID=A0A4Y9S166_9BURK|nr:heparan-alpha-glucosaminide N-acetyltransferase domain-containing protein [Massilia arenosa]TFW13679.1 DUF1624 domain-containing protein [Massilia arenosa]